VTAKLVGDYSGYTPNTQTATKATTELVSAQKEAAASNKAEAESTASSATAKIEASRQTRLLTTAQREANAAAREAAAANAEATASLSAAQKEVAAATKDTSELGAARRAAAQEALSAAEKEAAAAAETKAAAEVQAKSATAALTAFKDESAAARENAAMQATNAKATEDAAAKRTEAYKSTSKVALASGAVLAGAFIIAEKATSDFNKSLSGVQAVSNASAADMDKLRGAALQAGKDTAFTATEAANAEGELVKAGVSVKDVLSGGLSGALSLAAAGQLDLADAATISANAMNTFALKGSDVPHIADVFAAAANKSAADVQQLAYAMQQGGLVAAQTGLTFEDTAAVLAAFSDRGLQGADAGTSLKTMLEKLNAPTTQAASLMQQLGIVTYDASGKFVGITQLSGELHDKLGALTDAQRNQALATIFGSDAIRSASVLYNLGADGVKGYTQEVNDSGAAGRMAAEQMNNLSGDLKQLKGSIDTTLIKGGSGANEALRGLTQNATGAVNAFASMPKWLQETGVGLAGGAGSSLLLVGALTSLGGKLGSTRKTLAEVSEAGTGLKKSLASVGSFMIGPWGLAIAGATAVIGTFISKHKEAKVVVTDFTDAIKQDGDALGQTTTQAVANDLAHKHLFDTFAQLGVSSKTVTDAALGQKDAMAQVAASIDKIGKATGNDPMKMAKYIEAIRTVDAYSGAIDGQLKAQQKATAAAEDSTAATGTSAAETAKAAQNAKDAAAASLAQSAGQRAVAEAEAASGTATATATGKREAGAAATGRLARAIRDQALASDGSSAADKAAADAADKHTQSLYKAADSAKAAADAASKNKDANAGDAKATADAAEAAAEASDVHQSGVKWLLAVADAEAGAAGSARDLDSSVKDEVAAMKDAKDKASSLKDAMDALNGVHIAASKAAIDVQQRVADLTKALHENGRTLDITTEAGRNNMTAIDDLASAANNHAQAVAEESGSIEAGNKALDASRDQFDAVLRSAGLSTGQIEQFNRTLLNTPKLAPITLKVSADTSSANASLNALASKFAGLVVGGGPGGKKIFSPYATGGLIGGVGGPTSDSNLIAASKGEYMVRASKVSQPGVKAALDQLNFGRGNVTTVVPQFGGGRGGGGGSTGGGSTSTSVQVEMLVAGAEDYWLRAIRQSIRLRGGNVQQVLGS
jgi:TP901 family phage tail tape measure protein